MSACRDMQERLRQLAALSSDELPQDAQEHLAACPVCRRRTGGGALTRHHYGSRRGDGNRRRRLSGAGGGRHRQRGRVGPG